MDSIRHHAIVVTSWKGDYLSAARFKAVELGMIVTSVEDSGINGYSSFMICPDGSREGWPESDLGDDQRAAFVNWITEEQRANRGYWQWAVIQYGDDDGGLRHRLIRRAQGLLGGHLR